MHKNLTLALASGPFHLYNKFLPLYVCAARRNQALLTFPNTKTTDDWMEHGVVRLLLVATRLSLPGLEEYSVTPVSSFSIDTKISRTSSMLIQNTGTNLFARVVMGTVSRNYPTLPSEYADVICQPRFSCSCFGDAIDTRKKRARTSPHLRIQGE